MNLEVKLTREVKPDEIDSMIFGTGALGYGWWGSVTKRDDGMYVFTHDDGNSDEGAHDKQTVVSPAGIVGAAGIWLAEQVENGGMNGDIRDAIDDDLGYLDAYAADCVLQQAVLKSIVFG